MSPRVRLLRQFGGTYLAAVDAFALITLIIQAVLCLAT
jgi:hypothetical protein